MRHVRRRFTLPASAAALLGGLALALGAFGGSPAPAAVAGTTHPRIYLDSSTLSTLRARAAANSPEWVTLKGRCDAFLTGTVEWPDGNNYPDSNSIGEGYQGDGYYPSVLDLGLCYQMELPLNASLAAQYGAKGFELLCKMTAPSGPHAPDPLRDSGYGIRNYVTGMAIGYDWLYQALSKAPNATTCMPTATTSGAMRNRLIAAMHRWITAFETGGFERDFPQGNYYAGYYDAKALAGLAVEGDDPASPSLWSDWLTNVHGKLVQPYYAKNLSGGGWPEGWNYGPLGTFHMSSAVLAAKSAKNLDLVHSQTAPFAFPLNAARFLLYFTWPDLKTQEDSDFLYDGDNPSPTHHWLVTFEAALLQRFGDSFAPYFHSYARAVRAVQPEGEFGQNWDPAINFLFWDNSAPEKSYTTLPRSYLAKGIEMASTRSAWGPSGIWAEFKSGPYTNYQENGEELFDQGSLAIVNGKKPFLVNAWGALVRNTPGTSDGSPLWQDAYDDVENSDGARDLFNVFYVDTPSPGGQGNYLRTDGARTTIDRFEDKGTYVEMRGLHLEDMYPRNSGQTKTVSSWTREVLYIRPELFVVFDRTQISSAAIGQRMDFHFRGALINKSAGRYDVGTGTKYSGTVTTVLPAAANDSVVNVFSSNKVYRLEVRPPSPVTKVRWATVLDAAPSSTQSFSAARLGGAGVLLTRGATRYAVLQGPAPVSYTIPGTVSTKSFVTGLTPGAGYTVNVTGSGPWTVSVQAGGSTMASAAGVLSFTTP